MSFLPPVSEVINPQITFTNVDGVTQNSDATECDETIVGSDHRTSIVQYTTEDGVLSFRSDSLLAEVHRQENGGSGLLFNVFATDPDSVTGLDRSLLTMKMDSNPEGDPSVDCCFDGSIDQADMEGSFDFLTRCVAASPFAREKVIDSLHDHARSLNQLAYIGHRYTAYLGGERLKPGAKGHGWKETRCAVLEALETFQRSASPGCYFFDAKDLTACFGDLGSPERERQAHVVTQSIIDSCEVKDPEDLAEKGPMVRLLRVLIPYLLKHHCPLPSNEGAWGPSHQSLKDGQMDFAVFDGRVVRG